MISIIWVLSAKCKKSPDNVGVRCSLMGFLQKNQPDRSPAIVASFIYTLKNGVVCAPRVYD